MEIGSDSLVPISSQVLLYRGLRPVYFALEAKVEAFYHIARARIIAVNQYHCIVIPVLVTKLSARSSAIRLCSAKISLLKVIHNSHKFRVDASYMHGESAGRWSRTKSVAVGATGWLADPDAWARARWATRAWDSSLGRTMLR